MTGHGWQKRKEKHALLLDEFKNEFGDIFSEATPKISGINRLFSFPRDDQIAIADLLRASDVMVNVYSTMMIEACIFDLPVINVAYAQYRDTSLTWSVYDQWDHIVPVNQTGGVINAYQPDELHDYIRRCLSNGDTGRENRRELVNRLVSVNQGRAGHEIGRHLCELLGT